LFGDEVLGCCGSAAMMSGEPPARRLGLVGIRGYATRFEAKPRWNGGAYRKGGAFPLILAAKPR
jgi:hypothetical protein